MKFFKSFIATYSPVKDSIVVNDRWGTDANCKHGDVKLCKDRYIPSELSVLSTLIEYQSDDDTQIYFWNFEILTMWNERAPYNRHASKVSDK